ncbi:hypothetical protein QLG12_01130 [Pseudomonas sp. V88_4]|uniref:hypothetical protein n=1 Tax=Pseudomonas sp. V88_4 TaxID=3044229 RepID=UPI00249EE468|nr:hypothetical protein [Pseudomonas sp. V88_4]MDI3396804.1 hypothetical protein [Pseudomonas sp. V88_4]
MDTDDDNEKDFPDGEMEGQSTGNVEFGFMNIEPSVAGEAINPESPQNPLVETKILRAEKDGYWAEIEVSTIWEVDGTSFDCRVTRYRTKSSNAGLDGKLYFSLHQEPRGSTSGYSESVGRASQYGQWSNLDWKAVIPTTTKKARIDFTFVYSYFLSGIVLEKTLEKFEIIIWYFPPPPQPTLVSRNFNTSTFEVTGTGGLAGALMVLDDGAGTLATRVQPTGGAWSVPVTVADNVNTQRMQAYQQVYGVNSPRTPLVYMYRAKLTYPTAGAIVPMKDLVYQAIGAPDSKMFALNSKNIYESWSDQHLVNSSGVWQGASIRVLPSGNAEVKVRFYDNPDVSASYDYTQSVAFKVLGYPRITLPTADSLQNSNFDLSGDNGLAQSRIVAYYDLTGTAVGESTVRADGTWTIPVAGRAGLVSLAVEQFAGGKSSGRGALRTFKIKPPQPNKLTVQVDAQGKVTLGGVGHVGATFYLHVQGDFTPFHSFTVTTSPWTVLFPDWLPGTSLIGGRQSVPDSAGQPIYSDWAPESTTVVVPVPPPTLSFRVSPDGIPTFFGTGRIWSGQPAARVEVRLNNAHTAIVPIVEVEATSTWSSEATERWAPGTYSVTATQWFKTLQSEWVQPPVSAVIPAPPAVIEKVTPNGLFATVVGQCWPGAELTIKFDDNSTPHRVTDTDKDGQWDFQSPTAFRPGRHTVRVTQTFGGQTSSEVSMAFDIVVSVLVITPPPGGETDHLPVLQGTGGIDGFTIRVFDYVTHDLLGEALATGDAWSVPIKELDYQTHTVFAIQVLGDLQSVPSTSVTFTVVLFAPTIDFPETETSVPRTFAVEGYARAGKGFDRPEVDVYLDDVPHRVYPHFGDGYFKQYFTRPLGPCVLKARQYFKDQESPPSEDVLVTIVPDKALIETPAIGEAVGKHSMTCGFGYPGDGVVVALRDGTELGRTEVRGDGTWFCPVELPDTASDLSLLTEQRNGEFHSGWSEPRPVQRLAAPPTFNEPSEGKWEGPTPEFTGVAQESSRVDVVAWYDAEEKHASALVTNEGRWAGASERNLPAGPQWARAVQVVGGKRSMPADSKRFEIAPSGEPPRRHPTPQ